MKNCAGYRDFLDPEVQCFSFRFLSIYYYAVVYVHLVTYLKLFEFFCFCTSMWWFLYSHMLYPNKELKKNHVLLQCKGRIVTLWLSAVEVSGRANVRLLIELAFFLPGLHHCYK